MQKSIMCLNSTCECIMLNLLNHSFETVDYTHREMQLIFVK